MINLVRFLFQTAFYFPVMCIIAAVLVMLIISM